ncbi:MAG: NAD(P)-dependent oxidoreductase [Thermoproteota archaeon]
MRVLVTGASGRLGPYVVRELERAGHDLALFSRRQPAPSLAHLPWTRGDITVYEDCERAMEGGFDAVQHLAAVPGPTDHPSLGGGALPFDATMRTNIMGTYYLLRAAVKKGVRIFVMTGSNCALGHGLRISNTPFPLRYLPVDEGHPSDVEDSYSFSKLAGELLLESYARAYGMRTYVLRSAGICDAARREEIARNARPARAWDPWMWAWVGSEDLASAHRLLMEEAGSIGPHGVFYCNGDDTTALEPSLELVEKFNPSLLPFAKNLEGHASMFSNRKLRSEVGWEPRTSWRDRLRGVRE